MSYQHRSRGFTLLEVMAALFIIALGMLAAIQSVTQSVNTAAYLRDKTMAQWVAMNTLTEMRLGLSPISAGDKEGDVMLANVQWHWRAKLAPFPGIDPALKLLRADINVAPKDAGPEASIASVFGAVSTQQSNPTIITWDVTPVGPNQPNTTGGGAPR